MNQHEKQKYSVGIVGMGFVGTAMQHLFPEAIVYDKYKPVWPSGWGGSSGPRPEYLMEQINKCEIVFVCVPTDAKEDGSVDLSAIEDVASWLKGPTVVIKSTVPPNSTGKINQMFGGYVVYNPEFLTEKNWKKDVENETRVVLGGYPPLNKGDKDTRKIVARAYQKVYGQEIAYLYCTPPEAMMTKYVSNAFLATKVSFCNQIAGICEALGLDYDVIRELWLHDKRVGRTHTLIREQKGFGGYCLPKDLKGLIHTSRESNHAPVLLETVDAYNELIRKEDA